MTEKWFQSKTVWTGVGQIFTGVAGYCTGQMDISGAGALILSGAYQIIQRVMAIKKANQEAIAACPCLDAGPPEAVKPAPGA